MMKITNKSNKVISIGMKILMPDDSVEATDSMITPAVKALENKGWLAVDYAKSTGKLDETDSVKQDVKVETKKTTKSSKV